MKANVFIAVALYLASAVCGANESRSGWTLETGALKVDHSNVIDVSSVSGVLWPYYYHNIVGSFTNTGEESSESVEPTGFFLGASYSFGQLDTGVTYYDLGESTVRIHRTFHHNDDNYDGFATIKGTSDLRGIGAFVRANVQVLERVQVSPKLGVLHWEATAKADIVLDRGPNGVNSWHLDGSDNGQDAYFGMSITYAIKDDVGVGVEWDRFSIDGTEVESIGMNLMGRF